MPENASIYSKAATENEDDDSQDEDVVRASQDINAQGKPGTPKGSSATIVPPEAQPPSIAVVTQPPLEGYSLFIFGPDNRFRLRLNDLLNQT